MKNKVEKQGAHFLYTAALLLVIVVAELIFIGCSAENSTKEVIDIPLITDQPEKKTPLPSIKPDAAGTIVPTSVPTPDATAKPTQSPQADEVKTDRNYPVENESFYFQKLDERIKRRITGMSYPNEGEECRITYDDLRYVGILYWDFEGREHDGELIVNRRLAKEVTEIFYSLYQERYPLASVRLVDDYGEPGDDNNSMAANNSSAFNYRRVTGSKKLSRHSYGAAIDVNPLFNPYIDGDRIAPPGGKDYANRSMDFPGKIDHDDLCYRLFTQHGWAWGGDWSGDKDYQHFSKDIGEY